MAQPQVSSLPASGNLSLSTVGAYFKDTAPYNLSLYLRGGAYVPDVPANAGIPTSLPVSIRDFLGATRVTVTLITASIYSSATAPTDATTTYRVAADGTVKEITNSGTFTNETWLLDGAAGDYEVRFNHTGGTAPTGTLNTWLALSADREVSISATGLSGDFTTSDVEVEIRLAGETESMAIINVNLQAEVM